MKQFAIVAVLVLAMGTIAFSQAVPGGIARQVAMGGSNGGTNVVLNPFIWNDPAFMFVNPAYQATYKDYGWSNIAGGGLTGLSTTGGQIANDGYGHQTAGIAFGLNNDWNLGAILSYDPSAVNVVTGLPGAFPGVRRVGTAGGPQTIPGVFNVWELVASTHMSSMDLGFGVSYGWSNNNSKANSTTPVSSSETEASASVWGFRAGLLADLGSGSSLDLSAMIHLDKATDKITLSPVVVGQGGEYSASGTELQFNARGKFHVSNKVNFVPYGILAIVSAEPKEDAPPNDSAVTTRAVKLSGLAYAVGLGGEYHTSNIYMAGGLSWQTAQLKTEVNDPAPTGTTTTTNKYTAIPVVNIGAEWQFLEWLAGRVGYYRSIGSVNNKTETPTGSFERYFSAPNSAIAVGAISPANSDGMVTLGLGFKFSNWALDATVSEEALRRGFGLIGAQDNINTFGFLTGSFNFAGGGE